MLIASVWCGDGDEYRRMARVLDHTARVHHPHAVVAVVHTQDVIASRSDAFIVKARAWTDLIMCARDGDELLLLDVDTFFVGDGSSCFQGVSAIGVTTRGSLDTLNSGVLAVRVSDAVREWIAPWEERTRVWCARNVGRVWCGDQDALREMCIDGGVTITQLPCAIYNAQQHCWPPVDGCKIVHVKSDARRILFGGALHGNPGAHSVASLWSSLEASVQ